MPPKPENVQVMRRNETAVEVTWSHINFEISGYRVYYSMEPSRDLQHWKYKDVGSYTSLVMKVLPKKAYAFRVAAKSVDNRFGPPSQIVLTNEIGPGKMI